MMIDTSRRHYLRYAIHALRRTVFPNFRVNILGSQYHVSYEARRAKADRDYPILQALARNKHCIFDIGANMGLASLMMVNVLSEDARIYAFEASEEACRIIRTNAALNGLDAIIQVVNAVVSDKSGQVVDFYWSFAAGGASTIRHYLGHADALTKITLSIDDFVQQTGIQPDLLKIDVEGAEYKVLAGIKGLLRQARPTLIVELHSWSGMTIPQNAATIMSLLSQVEYNMIYLRTKQVVHDSTIMEGRGRCHVLLIPRESRMPVWLSNFDTLGL